MPARYTGEKSPAALEQWLYQMGLYLVASNTPRDAWVVIAATNLDGAASLWLQSSINPQDLPQVTWEAFVDELRGAFLPRDAGQRYMAAFLRMQQGSSTVDAYCIAFRKALMLAGNVSEEVALATFV